MGGGGVELGELVAGAVRSVVTAQEELDAHARRRTIEYMAEPEGSLAVPPLWYGFTGVALEIEMSASLVPGVSGPRLRCRPVDAADASLYGYRAVSGTRLRLILEPRGVVPVKAGDGGDEQGAAT